MIDQKYTNHNKKINLTIAIPTYNRDSLLKENLNKLLPQLYSVEGVELLIIDNASTDSTFEVCNKASDEGYLTYIKLNKNLGMAFSQYECFSRARGDYIWILADDDMIEENGINIILESISSKYDIYSFNYKAINESISSSIGPNESKKFEQGYQLINLRSVGHMSAFVFRTEVANNKMKELLKIFPLSYFNSTRGIFGCISLSISQTTNLPLYYEAKVLFSSIDQKNLDYNGLMLLCLTAFTHFNIIRKMNIIGDEIYKYQYDLISMRILRSYIRWYPTLSFKEMLYVDHLLIPFFSDNFTKKLVFRIVRIKLVKYFLDKIFKIIL